MVLFRRCLPRSSGPLAILAIAGLSCGAAPLTAQQGLPAPLDYESPLQGVVLGESDFQPIESATVSIVGTDLVTRTDAYGSFAFPNAPTGALSLRVTAPDRITTVEEVDVDADRVLHVQFLLPRIDAVLAEFLVIGDRSDVRSGQPSTAADLVARQVPGLLFPQGYVGDWERGIRLRGANTFAAVADPHVFVDGVRVAGSQAYEFLTMIPADDVDRIEVLRGANAAFLHQYGANGVIHIYTKR